MSGQPKVPSSPNARSSIKRIMMLGLGDLLCFARTGIDEADADMTKPLIKFRLLILFIFFGAF